MSVFILVSLFTLLFLGLPFVIVIITVGILALLLFCPEVAPRVLVGQILTGISPIALLCVPMFILAANIITQGDGANRLVNLVRAFLGHIPGGLPISLSVSCTLFGSVSGSTMATVAAIGKPLRPMLLKAGYSSPFSLALIINSSDIALLIPPSVGFIIYGVATRTSIGELFLAGVFPGLLICLLFCIYCFLYSITKHIGLLPRVGWKERGNAAKRAVLMSGFPVIILGGIYSGIFTPTEAAASSVVYALILEGLVYGRLSVNQLKKVTLETGLLTAVVLILVGVGQALSWLISYSRIPQDILPVLFGQDPSALRVILIINVTYFVACMFVDPIVAIYVFSSIFQPYVVQAEISYILLGALVVLQAAIGSATPPFGCDIFTAMTIFRRPYFEVIRETPVFIVLLLMVAGLIILCPDIALFLPTHAFAQ